METEVLAHDAGVPPVYFARPQPTTALLADVDATLVTKAKLLNKHNQSNLRRRTIYEEASDTKKGKACKVTFELPAEVNAQTACLVGEFKVWSRESLPITRGEDGSFSVVVSLKPGQAYRFRYLLEGERWENDTAADAYVPNPFGSDDSVV